MTLKNSTDSRPNEEQIVIFVDWLNGQRDLVNESQTSVNEDLIFVDYPHWTNFWKQGIMCDSQRRSQFVLCWDGNLLNFLKSFFTNKFTKIILVKFIYQAQLEWKIWTRICHKKK